MSDAGDVLAILRAKAKVFEDGMLGFKTPTDLAPGEYEAVVVLRSVPPSEGREVDADAPIEPMDRFLERMRHEHLQAALVRAGGNRTQAAKLLGVDPRTVFRLLDKEGGI
jgi:DNA-binding NtrC family response regulator